MKSYLLSCVAVLFLLVSCHSSGQGYHPDGAVLATTEWVASFARMAGVPDVRCLTPRFVMHPPEYELKPSDILAVHQAAIILFAGYERQMLEKINQALDRRNPIPMVQIETNYTPSNVEKQIRMLAHRFQTEQAAERQLVYYHETFQQVKDVIHKHNLDSLRYFVHQFQQPTIHALGLNIVGTFGPQPIEASDLSRAMQTHPDILIDNAHNPVGSAIQEAMPQTSYVRFLNFPGLYDTKEITDVLLYNMNQLKQISTTGDTL
jgi:zinc transport system substrate-binding protein